MWVTVISIAIGILSGIGAFLSTHKLYDKRRTFPNGFTRDGVIVAICLCGIIILTVLQRGTEDKNIQAAQELRDSLQIKKQKIITDSLIAHYDSLIVKNNAGVSDALGRYGYKFDSIKGVLFSIRDSAKMKVVETESPTFTIAGPPMEKGISLVDSSFRNGYYFFKFKVNYISSDAASGFFKLKSSILAGTDLQNIFYIGLDDDVLGFKTQIARDFGKDGYVNFYTAKTFKILFLWIRGSYKRADGVGNYYVDEVFFLNMESKTIGNVKGDTRETVIKLAKANE